MKKTEVKLEPVIEAEEKPKVILEAEVEKPAEGGDLTRSIDTLAKLVDQSNAPVVAASGGGGTEKPVQKPIRNGNKGGFLGMSIAFILGLCLGIGAGYGLWGERTSGGADELEIISAGQSISPTATPETTTPTPAATEQKRTDLKVKVLNGTGGKGVAAAAKEYLESLGYVNVETGNAKRTDYTKTEVILAKTKSAYWAMLKKDLGSKYTVVDGFTTDEEVLAAAGGVDAVVIIGE